LAYINIKYTKVIPTCSGWYT